MTITTSKAAATAGCALLALCALVPAGCVLPGADDETDGATEADAGASDETNGGGGSTGGSSPTTMTDPTSADESGTGDTATDDNGTDTDTGPSGSVVGDDVIFYVRELAASDDALWAIDVGTNEAHEVTALDGTSEIRSIAIHPSRTGLVIASTFETGDYQASEAIYGFDFNDTLVFGEPTLIMPAIPTPVGASAGYQQQISDLRFHPDGSLLWFGHSFQFDIGNPGGGTLGALDLATGQYELYLDIIGDCTVNTGPAPSPDGSLLASIRGVCIDSSHEGVVAFGIPPAGDPQMVVPSTNLVFAGPQWLPAGDGLVYGGNIDFDANGDGTPDVSGDALMLLEIATGDQYVLLPPTDGYTIWDFAMAPTGDRFVACVNRGGPRDLLLVDLSGTEPEVRWLTDDGVSCYPAW
mgnify:CR=1 FL=1